MDWQQVMSRPDYSQREKAENWKRHCERSGLRYYPDAYKPEKAKP